MKKKIAIVGLSAVFGGIESFILNLVMNSKNYEYHVINVYPCNTEKDFYKTIQKYAYVHELPNYRTKPIHFIKGFLKLNNEIHFDIFHYNMASAAYIVPLIAAKLSKIKIIISHSHNNQNDKGFLKLFIHSINKHFLNVLSNIYFACSLSAAKFLFNKKTIQSNRFYIINNSIDIDEFKYSESIRNKMRKGYQIEEDTTIIGHVGNFKKIKNHKFLVEIFYEYHKKNPHTILMMVGTGSELDNIKSLVEKYNLHNSVIFTGMKKNVSDYYQMFDYFVFPSFAEGLGIVLLEAQASGLPCFINEELPEEIDVTNNIYRISLKEDAKKWADIIEKVSINKNRSKIENRLLSNDNMNCIENIEKVYKEISL